MVLWTHNAMLVAAPRELIITNNVVHQEYFVHLINKYLYNLHKSVILKQCFPA